MKVLVVGGCATRAYVEFFKKCFPEWETRAALLVQVNEWVEESNEAFLSYVESADIFVGLTNREPLKSLMPENSLNVFLPSFDFFGYLPDSVFLLGVQSPLELGVIHSRIVVSSYIAGNSEAETSKLFNRDHFENLGYFKEYASSKDKLFEKFDAHNIDLRERFKHWSKNGNFLYTVNHPHTEVFFDIAYLAMKNHFAELLPEYAVNEARETVENYMGDGLIWAMYPEIAEEIGVPCLPRQWRTSEIRNEPIYLDLAEFIKRSFQQYKELGEFSENLLQHLGGMDEIIRYAGLELPDQNNEQQAA